jgi:hypothetical protein
MTRTDQYRSPARPRPALKRPALISFIALVSLLLAACQPGAGVTPSAAVSAVQLQGSGSQVRQGHGLITLEVTGDQLADIAVANLGSIGGDVILNNATAATIEFTIPHGAPIGWQTLSLTTGVGPATFPNALEVTPITAGPAGNDLTGVGTTEDPFRSLAHALSITDPGDTVMLLDGTYTSADGEVWPTLVPLGVGVRGESQAGTLLDGQLAGVHGVILQDGSSVADLSVTGFNAGSGTVENVRAYQNATGGLIGVNTAQLTVNGGRFDQNGIGITGRDDAGLTMSGTQVDHNGNTGVYLRDGASLDDSGSTISENPYGIYASMTSSVSLDGTAVTGNTSRGLWVGNSATATAQESTFDGNLYGVWVSNFGELLAEGGSASHNLRDGFFFSNASSATLNGVEIHDNDDDKLGGVCFSGIAAFTTGQLRLRDTSFADNCFGIYTATEAAVFDLGTAVDPGGNTFVNSTNFHLYDNRPALGVPNGVVISVIGTTFSGIEPSGGVHAGIDQQVVGPNQLWRINQANQRMEFQP